MAKYCVHIQVFRTNRRPCWGHFDCLRFLHENNVLFVPVNFDNCTASYRLYSALLLTCEDSILMLTVSLLCMRRADMVHRETSSLRHPRSVPVVGRRDSARISRVLGDLSKRHRSQTSMREDRARQERRLSVRLLLRRPDALHLLATDTAVRFQRATYQNSGQRHQNTTHPEHNSDITGNRFDIFLIIIMIMLLRALSTGVGVLKAAIGRN